MVFSKTQVRLKHRPYGWGNLEKPPSLAPCGPQFPLQEVGVKMPLLKALCLNQRKSMERACPLVGIQQVELWLLSSMTSTGPDWA